MEKVKNGFLEFGIAQAAMIGEPDSGDRHLVKSFPNGTLIAVVDGIGHGKEAAQAADLAVETLAKKPGEPIISLFRDCHEILRKTRGAVMTIACFNAEQETLTWMGVGNVTSLLLRKDPAASPSSESVILRSGVVGGQLPLLRAAIVPIERGDTLILATDGIGVDFFEKLSPVLSPQKMADHILAQHKKSSDDALVLVARYRGRDEN